MALILITGGIGPTARGVAESLLREGADVRLLVNDASRAEQMRRAGADIVEGDLLNGDSLQRAMSGADRIFLTSPPGSELARAQLAAVAAARGAGVNYIVKLSMLGARLGSPAALCRAHAEVEQGVEASGIPYAHLRTNFFMQNFLEAAPSWRRDGVIRAPLGHRTVSFIDRRDLSYAAARAIMTSDFPSQAYELTGPESLGLDQITGILSTVLRREIRYQTPSSEDTFQTMTASGADPWFARATVETYEDMGSSGTAAVTGDFAALAGRPATSFAAFAAAHETAFRGG